MLAQLATATLSGIDAQKVDVEVDIAHGLPAVTIVGLPDTAVQEARERIRAALINSGFTFPKTRVTINLAPADVKKEGSGFDFPIALGILVASGVLRSEHVKNIFAIGELALDGSLRPVKGGLLFGLCARDIGASVLLPLAMSRQAHAASPTSVIAVENLTQAVMHLQNRQRIASYKPSSSQPQDSVQSDDDLAYIIGQQQAKRALLIAASGSHSVLFAGPPGTGKTMLARCLPTLLPPLLGEEQLEVTKIWSAAGELDPDIGLMYARPFRSPHHSTSAIALIGGGAHARPGEVSLAHRGVLFLDECTEFPRSVLNMLRQPLESGVIHIMRAERRMMYPAAFQLIASTNPCPCGLAGSEGALCTCSMNERQRYQKRLSGPLMDRIDMVVHVPRQPFTSIEHASHESSRVYREKAIAVRAVQRNRQGGVSNAQIRKKDMLRLCSLDSDGESLLIEVVNRLRLSRRAADRIVKVGRTIADLEGSGKIQALHIAESIQYRVQTEEIFG